MPSTAIKKMELRNRIVRLPEKEIDAVEKFVARLLAQKQGDKPRPISLAGMWKGRGFERIADLESKILKIRTELGNSILGRSLMQYLLDTVTIVRQFAETTLFDELHDRLILSTAKWLDIPLISSDRCFEGIEGIQLIWK